MADLTPRRKTNLNTAIKGVVMADNTALSEPCVAVNASTAGSVNVVWLDGTTTTYYFKQGDNPVQIQQCGTGGAALGLVALYN
jgi:hypothetical protein